MGKDTKNTRKTNRVEIKNQKQPNQASRNDKTPEEKSGALMDRKARTSARKMTEVKSVTISKSVNASKSKTIRPKEEKSMIKATASQQLSVTIDSKTMDKMLKTEKVEKEKVEKKKWAGEEAAIAWSKKILNADIVAEYEEIKAIPYSDGRCITWAAHMQRNRHPDYKCFDDNRIIVQMTKCDYINASKIFVQNFPRDTFLVQLPKLDTMDALEEFWSMIFTEQCLNVHVIAHNCELEAGIEKFCAQENGGFYYANGFFVNTKKVEKTQDRVDCIVELLPQGCSNSLVVQVYIHTYWKDQCGPDKFMVVMKSAQMISKNEGDNKPVALVSVKGAGRNATLLALSIIIGQLNKNIEPNIKEIVRLIREQRPMAVDTIHLYASLYMSACWFIKAKMPTGQDELHFRLKKFRTKAAAMFNAGKAVSCEETRDGI